MASAAGTALLAYHFLWRDKRLGVAGFGRRSPGFVAGWGLVGLAAVYGALVAAAVVVGIVYVALGGDPNEPPGGADADEVAFTAASSSAWSTSFSSS